MDKTFNNIPPSDIGINAATSTQEISLDVALKMLEQMKTSIACLQEAVKTITEYVSVLVDILVNDDGSMKDIARVNELKSSNDLHKQYISKFGCAMFKLAESIPSEIECTFAKNDRSILEKNFQSWKDVFRLYLPMHLIIAFTAAIFIFGGMWLMKSGQKMKDEYEYRIEQMNIRMGESRSEIPISISMKPPHEKMDSPSLQ